MGRKPVKVYLSAELRGYLKELCYNLGLSESEVMKISVLNYMQDLGLLQVRHRKVRFVKSQPFAVAPKM
jgi:hypothetical protein